MDRYYPALVCRRGHVETWMYEPDKATYPMVHEPDHEYPKMCADCGSLLLSACPACGARIRGAARGWLSPQQVLSDFCDVCGTPYPWASRQARIYQLEDLLDEDPEIDEAVRLRVRAQLRDLAGDQGDDEAGEREQWVRVKQMWPGVAQAGLSVLTTVLTAEMKRALGLPL